MKMLHTALALAQRGLCIFPCLPRDKTPAISGGCLAASSDQDQINAWWSANADYNIGVATGPRSGIFVLDVDGAEAELSKLEALFEALPPSVEIVTARGRHVWFKHPADYAIKNSAGKIAPGLDIRGDGGYVLAPPSVHPSGKHYTWSVDSTDRIADAPAWLLEKIAAPKNGGNGATPPAAWREFVRDGVAEGRRNCSVARLAGHLLRRRVDALVALDLVQVWNAARCTPPLPADDVTRIVDSIAGRELRRRAAV